MIDLCELLFARGLPKGEHLTKFVRHTNRQCDVWALAARNQLNLYQSSQSEPRFFECKHLVSFLAEDFSRARLYGVYRVGPETKDPDKAWPAEFISQEVSRGPFWYELEKMPGFEDLENRVVINWRGPKKWDQWLSPREVVEILPVGYVKEFPGFDEVILTHDELREIISHPTSNREWHRALSSVAGVYLITDMSSGRQYVGSAYGAAGILGRWSSYAQTRHDGNRLLEDLLQKNPDAVRNFQFSILRVMPTSMTRDEVVASEVIYKLKLGSRAHRLNLN